MFSAFLPKHHSCRVVTAWIVLSFHWMISNFFFALTIVVRYLLNGTSISTSIVYFSQWRVSGTLWGVVLTLPASQLIQNLSKL